MPILNPRGLAAAAFASISLAAAFPAAATSLVDGGFETQATGVYYCYFGFITAGGAACRAGSWAGGNGGGLQVESNTPWPGQKTPDGSYYGFVQNLGYLEQTFTASGSGTTSLNWLDAGRPGAPRGGNQSYTVLLTSVAGVQTLGSYATTSYQPFTARNATQFNLVAGRSYTLRFQGLNNVFDDTAFIDQVVLGATTAGVPEPAGWALMIFGFGMAGSLFRRQRYLPG